MDIALAIILHPTEARVLLARRLQTAHLGGFWEFPGGKIEAGETPAEAAIREAREEVGLAVRLLSAWPPITHAYPDRTVTLHPFLCRAETDSAQTNASQQIVWASLDSLGDYDFPPANAPILARLEKREWL